MCEKCNIYRSTKTIEHFLNDEGYKSLLTLSKQTPGFVKRSKAQIVTYYRGVDANGTVKFLTPSGTSPGVYYIQTVELADLKKLLKRFQGKKKLKDIVNMAIKGNLKVSCNDPDGNDEPSWIYWGFKYKATVSKYISKGQERRFPEIRNPKLRGSVCKHLIAVLTNLPFHAIVITRDLKKLGVGEVDEEEPKTKKP